MEDELKYNRLTVPELHLSYPFPEMRSAREMHTIVSLKLETLTDKRGKTTTLTAYTLKGQQIVWVQPKETLTQIANFISDTVSERPQVKTPYCFAHEMPDGNLFLHLTDRGLSEVEQSGRFNFLLDGAKDMSISTTNDHPTILPPFVHYKGGSEKMWYFMDGNKVGVRHFFDRLISQKWVILRIFEV